MGFHLPFFPFYAAETLADGRVQSWTLEQFGAFARLLCYQWNDGDIPAGPTQLGRLLGVSAQEMTGIWSAIGDRFPEAPGRSGRLQNPRLEEERDKAIALSNKRAAIGLKGATARWQKESAEDGKGMRLPSERHSPGTGNGMATGCQIPSSDQITTTPSAELTPAEARWPLLAACLADLWDRKRDALWPSGKTAEATCDRLERAIAALGLPAAIEILDASLQADPEHPWLGWHLPALKAPPKKRGAAAPPPLDASFLASLGPARERAETEWAELAARVKRSAYPDALPQLWEEAREQFQAQWSEGATA